MSEEKRILIDAIDLTQAKKKFLEKKSWLWRLWHKIEDVEAEYKKFLYLICTNQDKTFVPWTQDLDDLWHEHILDTRKYRDDCARINDGKFIHHNPNLPRGTPDHAKNFSETKRLWQKVYGKTNSPAYQRGLRDGLGGFNMSSTSDEYILGHHDGYRQRLERQTRGLLGNPQD